MQAAAVIPKGNTWIAGLSSGQPRQKHTRNAAPSAVAVRVPKPAARAALRAPLMGLTAAAGGDGGGGEEACTAAHAWQQQR